MAAIMASTYKAYLGVGLGPLSVSYIKSNNIYKYICTNVSLQLLIFCNLFQFLTKFRIPHPGRVGGRFFIDIGMPLMLSWVLGGNG